MCWSAVPVVVSECSWSTEKSKKHYLTQSMDKDDIPWHQTIEMHLILLPSAILLAHGMMKYIWLARHESCPSPMLLQVARKTPKKLFDPNDGDCCHLMVQLWFIMDFSEFYYTLCHASSWDLQWLLHHKPQIRQTCNDSPSTPIWVSVKCKAARTRNDDVERELR